MQQFGIGGDGLCSGEFETTTNDRPARDVELGLVQLNNFLRQLVQVKRLKLRLRHFGKFAEASDDAFEVRDFRKQRGRTLLKRFVELLLSLLARAQKIFYSELQRKKRVLEFVGEAARQFSPGGDAFGLHQAFALVDQVARHLIEG